MGMGMGLTLKDGNVYYLVVVVITPQYAFVKSHRTVCLKQVNFIECKLSHNKADQKFLNFPALFLPPTRAKMSPGEAALDLEIESSA